MKVIQQAGSIQKPAGQHFPACTTIKNNPKSLAFTFKYTTFAPLFKREQRGLSYGVMVAQQVLVLFVLVRIRVGQHKRRSAFADLLLYIYHSDSYCG